LEQKTSSVEVIINALSELEKDMDNLNSEAEKESSLIDAEADKNLAKIKKSIDSSYDKAVDTIVNMILTINDSNNLQGNNNNNNELEPVKTAENIPKGSGRVTNRTNKSPSDKTVQEKKKVL
jgi:hypothetical protein